MHGEVLADVGRRRESEEMELTALTEPHPGPVELEVGSLNLSKAERGVEGDRSGNIVDIERHVVKGVGDHSGRLLGEGNPEGAEVSPDPVADELVGNRSYRQEEAGDLLEWLVAVWHSQRGATHITGSMNDRAGGAVAAEVAGLDEDASKLVDVEVARSSGGEPHLVKLRDYTEARVLCDLAGIRSRCSKQRAGTRGGETGVEGGEARLHSDVSRLEVCTRDRSTFDGDRVAGGRVPLPARRHGNAVPIEVLPQWGVIDVSGFVALKGQFDLGGGALAQPAAVVLTGDSRPQDQSLNKSAGDTGERRERIGCGGTIRIA